MPSRISDDSMLKATGKSLKEWAAILDKAGAKKMAHRDIAQLVYDQHLKTRKSGDWWSQTVTVEYERLRGLRAVNQTLEGFSVSIHKTIPSSVASLQRKWSTILKSPEVAKLKLERIPSKTKLAMLRYKAPVGEVVVVFEDRGNDKARMMIEARRLPKKSDVEKMRTFWKKIAGQM